MKNLWQRLQPQVFLSMMLQSWHTCICGVSHILLCRSVLQVGWGVSLHCYFQVNPEMFDGVQVRALAGSLKDIQRLVPQPLLQCLGCVLMVIALLEGEPSPQSEVLSALKQVFIKDLFEFCSVHLSLNPN